MIVFFIYWPSWGPKCSHITISLPEHMDDLIFNDSRWTVLVAVLAMRVDRLQPCRDIRLSAGPYCYNLPNPLCCHKQSLVWNMGLFLAYSQPSRYGCDMVWSPSKS